MRSFNSLAHFNAFRIKSHLVFKCTGIVTDMNPFEFNIFVKIMKGQKFWPFNFGLSTSDFRQFLDYETLG